MEDEHECTVPCDETVALESPVSESWLLNLDTNTEVLNLCESTLHSGDRMEDPIGQEVVLDSDDEGGNQNTAANSVRGRFPVRLSGRDATGLLRRRQIPAGYIKNKCLDNDASERVNLESVRESSMENDTITNYNCKIAEFDYAESQEDAESHVKALRFVDYYLSFNDLGSLIDVQTKKNMSKSIPPVPSKGSHSLAMRVNVGSSALKLKTFDWAANPNEKDEFASPRMKKDSTFEFIDDKPVCLSSDEETDNINLHAKISHLQSNEKMPGNMFSSDHRGADLLSSNGSDYVGSNSGINIAHDTMEFDEQLNAGETRGNVEEVEEFSLVPDALDIGIDTQVAAEAMEELLHSVCPRFDVSSSDKGSNKINLDKCKSNHVSNYGETSMGWRSKGKRSKLMKISDVHDKGITWSTAKRNIVFGSRPRITLQPEEYGFTEQCILKDFQKQKFSDLNQWVYPKGKRSRQHTPSPAIGNNVEKYPAVNEGAQHGVEKLLVYKRRRKTLLVRDQAEGSVKMSVDLSSFINANEASVGSNTNKPSSQCGTFDDSKPSSLHVSSNMKSNLLSNGDSISLLVLEGIDKRKQPFNSLPRSPLMKELARLGYDESVPDFLSKDSRRQRAIKRVCILFSQNLDKGTLKRQTKIAARLGLSIVSCCLSATHFIADRFVRTRNMLEAIALGKPVVTHFWLENCQQAGYVIDEKIYILRDEKKEKEIGFNMPVSLSHAVKLPLLKGRKVLLTPNVKPGIDVINDLIKAVQGQAVQNIQIHKLKDKLIPDDLLILSCKEDYKICLQFLKKGAHIYDSELLLNGIVTQKLEYNRHRLFEEFKVNDHSCPSFGEIVVV